MLPERLLDLHGGIPVSGEQDFEAMPRHIKKLLKKLKEGLVRIYADELKAVYLYGSYARGEASSDSDIDVLVVLKGDFNYILDFRQI